MILEKTDVPWKGSGDLEKSYNPCIWLGMWSATRREAVEQCFYEKNAENEWFWNLKMIQLEENHLNHPHHILGFHANFPAFSTQVIVFHCLIFEGQDRVSWFNAQLSEQSGAADASPTVVWC